MRAIKTITTLIVFAFLADLYVLINRAGLFDLNMSLAGLQMFMDHVVMTDRSLIWLAILILLYVWNALNYRLAGQDEKLEKTIRLAALDLARRDVYKSTENFEPSEAEGEN